MLQSRDFRPNRPAVGKIWAFFLRKDENALPFANYSAYSPTFVFPFLSLEKDGSSQVKKEPWDNKQLKPTWLSLRIQAHPETSAISHNEEAHLVDLMEAMSVYSRYKVLVESHIPTKKAQKLEVWCNAFGKGGSWMEWTPSNLDLPFSFLHVSWLWHLINNNHKSFLLSPSFMCLD